MRWLAAAPLFRCASRALPSAKRRRLHATSGATDVDLRELLVDLAGHLGRVDSQWPTRLVKAVEELERRPARLPLVGGASAQPPLTLV